MPPQSINMGAAERRLRPGLETAQRSAVLEALEKESLWSGEILLRWIKEDYDVVVFQEREDADQRAVIAALGDNFDMVSTRGFRGWNVFIYVRKQPDGQPHMDTAPELREPEEKTRG